MRFSGRIETTGFPSLMYRIVNTGSKDRIVLSRVCLDMNKIQPASVCGQERRSGLAAYHERGDCPGDAVERRTVDRHDQASSVRGNNRVFSLSPAGAAWASKPGKLVGVPILTGIDHRPSEQMENKGQPLPVLLPSPKRNKAFCRPGWSNFPCRRKCFHHSINKPPPGEIRYCHAPNQKIIAVLKVLQFGSSIYR